jgi:hypothetical protein
MCTALITLEPAINGSSVNPWVTVIMAALESALPKLFDTRTQ